MSDDKLSSTIWQSNSITFARYEMTALEKNILYMVMAQMKKNDTVNRKFIVSAMQLMEEVGEQIVYKRFQEATKKLLTRDIELKTENGNTLQVTFISSAEYIHGKGLIEIELSEKIIPYYYDLKVKFTTFQLDMALSLNSVYSKRLYEMLCSYKNFTEKNFTIDLLELKKRLFVIDNKGIDKYANFSLFNTKVLSIAEREINDGKTDIYFTYTPIEGKKTGKGRKKIEKINFKIVSKNEPEAFSEKHIDLINTLKSEFKLRHDQAVRIVSDNTLESIYKKLYDTRLLLKDGTIRDVGAYLAKNYDVIEMKK